MEDFFWKIQRYLNLRLCPSLLSLKQMISEWVNRFRHRSLFLIIKFHNIKLHHCDQIVNSVFLFFLVGNPNAWRLGRIDELDHETAV